MTASSYSLLSGIGGTPLIQLTKLAPTSGARVFVKLESKNPTAEYLPLAPLL